MVNSAEPWMSAVLAAGSPIPNLLPLLPVVDNVSSKKQSETVAGPNTMEPLFYLSFTENNLKRLNDLQHPPAQLCASVRFLPPNHTRSSERTL